MTGAEAPLIANIDATGELEQENNLSQGVHENDTNLSRLPDAPPGLFIWLLVLSAGISGLLFGYDTGVISSTLVSIDDSLSDRQLTSLDKSVITSCTSLFALLISPFSSSIADSLGRKRVILVADLLFAVGAILQACSDTVAEMVAGRSIVGAGVGAASFVVPLYIAETAPADHRGKLITINVLFITLGQVVAYVIGWLFAEYGDKSSGWRWMVGLGAVPAVVQTVLLLGMPETPRWLVKAGRKEEALEVIRRVAGGKHRSTSDRVAHRVLEEIEVEIREESEARRRLLASREGMQSTRPGWMETWSELIKVRRNRRALIVACLLQGLQQLCGFNSLMYFSASIFTMVGFATPTLTSLTVAVTNFVFTVLALLLVDRIGRRRILLYSLPFMIVGLLLAAFGFSFISISPGPTSSPKPHPAKAGDAQLSPQAAAVMILISIMIYVASYAIGLGNVPWMQSELFSLSVRSVGSGVATGTNWLANFVVGLTFLPLMDAFGPPATFTMYGVICGVGLVLIWRIYPETTGLSLEEAASLLEGSAWRVR
ncbi:hypothetical protein MCOR25_010845 [Pyricularia grisea]|uniref:Major facilitator superfamily (MFS) profile domain-containing protein n=1 Tax=Pyricularia grisea TaxID=148305 RepID=A0A6P8AU04_PYRGI|nr:uncharacterized protein PgNI_09756 [Pyricularia grisea]KAI6348142.1 hypothetical protein MCOR25_010845 [Pyricularia grisea]TLD05588.1 hypothetical protein PgNI_09756 [Pyricularia grisea]